MNKKELIHALTFEYADVPDNAEVLLHVMGSDFEVGDVLHHFNNTDRPLHINGTPIGPNESYLALHMGRELRLTQ